MKASGFLPWLLGRTEKQRTRRARRSAWNKTYAAYRSADRPEELAEPVAQLRPLIFAASLEQLPVLTEPFMARAAEIDKALPPKMSFSERMVTAGGSNRAASLARTPVVVKTYKTAKEYQRDVAGMTSRGYVPQGQSQDQGHISTMRMISRGVVFGGLKKVGSSITVTWVKAAANG